MEPVNPAIAACHPALADPAAAEKDMVPAKEDIAAPSIPTAVPLLAFVNAFGYHTQPQFGGLQQPSLQPALAGLPPRLLLAVKAVV
jgi:hypothetical protein